MISFDRRYFINFDWISSGITLLISTIGLLFIYSSTYTQAVPYSVFFKKQTFGILTGIMIYIFFCAKDYRKLCKFGYFSYFAIIFLLIFTLIKGKIGMGAQRWIDLKLFKFQPSEVAKLLVSPFITYYLQAESETPKYQFNQFIPIIISIAIAAFLILKQPDLGTAIIFLLTAFLMIWMSGISKKIIYIFLISCSIIAPFALKFLKPYQRQRIEVFLGFGNSQKEGYQIEQSIIAIGSGGFFGKGILKGTQNKLLFLPESRTDFIFSVVCEEWGFLGAIIIILLYWILFLRTLIRISNLKDFFSKLLSIGLFCHIIFSMIINISMICGLMPIVGIPLPLMSYGISSLWVNCATLGWIQSITTKTFK